MHGRIRVCEARVALSPQVVPVRDPRRRAIMDRGKCERIRRQHDPLCVRSHASDDEIVGVAAGTPLARDVARIRAVHEHESAPHESSSVAESIRDTEHLAVCGGGVRPHRCLAVCDVVARVASHAQRRPFVCEKHVSRRLERVRRQFHVVVEKKHELRAGLRERRQLVVNFLRPQTRYVRTAAPGDDDVCVCVKVFSAAVIIVVVVVDDDFVSYGVVCGISFGFHDEREVDLTAVSHGKLSFPPRYRVWFQRTHR
mmetsp:Transcript_9156/g.24588  ORF Transcript_9156/g.24588 Transcript_9156/m.24588 type:complete len:255 (-) Transcript_9156:351-1115(-)